MVTLGDLVETAKKIIQFENRTFAEDFEGWQIMYNFLEKICNDMGFDFYEVIFETYIGSQTEEKMWEYLNNMYRYNKDTVIIKEDMF